MVLSARDHIPIAGKARSIYQLGVSDVHRGGLGRVRSGRDQDVAEALFGTQRDGGDIGSLTGRVDVWEFCLRLAANDWWFGFGYDGFWTPERIQLISEENQWGVNQAHSAYLDNLLGTGIIGLTLYASTLLLAVIAATKQFRRSRSEVTLIAATLLVFSSLHGLTESVVVSPVSSGTLLIILTAKLGFALPQRGGQYPRSIIAAAPRKVSKPHEAISALVDGENRGV